MFFVQVWFALTLEGDWGAVVELELEWWSCQSTSVEPKISPVPFRLLSHYERVLARVWERVLSTMFYVYMYSSVVFEQKAENPV